MATTLERIALDDVRVVLTCTQCATALTVSKVPDWGKYVNVEQKCPGCGVIWIGAAQGPGPRPAVEALEGLRAFLEYFRSPVAGGHAPGFGIAFERDVEPAIASTAKGVKKQDVDVVVPPMIVR